MIPTSPLDTLELKEGSNEDEDELDENVLRSPDDYEDDPELENPCEKASPKEEEEPWPWEIRRFGAELLI